MLEEGLLVRLGRLLAAWRDCAALRVVAELGVCGELAVSASYIAPAAVRNRDRSLALFGGVGVGLSVLACFAFWIATGWPDGMNAPIWAAVVGSFAAGEDDPAPAVRALLVPAGILILVVAFYYFIALPRITNTEVLIACLAPTFMLFSYLLVQPRTARLGEALGSGTSTWLALQSSYDASFPAYLNSSIALLIGVIATGLVFGLLGSLGSERIVRRLIRHNWITLARVAERGQFEDPSPLAGVLLHRLALLAKRFTLMPLDVLAEVTKLREMQAGQNVIDLWHVSWELQRQTSVAVQDMLASLAAACRAHETGPLPKGLLTALDKATATVFSEPAGIARNKALISLTGLRWALFPAAPAYEPQGNAEQRVAA